MRNEIRDIFQDSFDNYESPHDQQQLLRAIAEKRQIKEKRRGFLIFLIPGLLVMCLIFVLAGMRIEGSDSQVVNTTKIQNQKKDIGYENQPAVNQEQIISVIAKAEKTSQMKSDEEKMKNKVFSAQLVSNEKRTNDLALSPSVEFVSQIEVEEKVSYPIVKEVSEKTTLHRGNAVLEIVDDNNIELENKPGLEESESPSDSKIELDSPSNSGLKIAKENEDHQKNPDVVKIISDDISTNTVDALNHNHMEKSSSKQNWWIQFYAMAPIGRYSISTNNKTLTEERSKYVHSVIGYKYELTINRRIGKKWAIGAGLNYGNWKRLFEWSGAYILDKDGNYVADEIGPAFQVSGDYFLSRERQIKKYERRSLIEVPLYLRFQSAIGNWMISPFTSVSYNIDQNISGYTIGNNFIPEALSASSMDYSLNYGLGIDISYGVSDYLKIGLTTSVRTREISDGILKERIIIPELGLGIGFSF